MKASQAHLRAAATSRALEASLAARGMICTITFAYACHQFCMRVCPLLAVRLIWPLPCTVPNFCEGKKLKRPAPEPKVVQPKPKEEGEPEEPSDTKKQKFFESYKEVKEFHDSKHDLQFQIPAGYNPEKNKCSHAC